MSRSSITLSIATWIRSARSGSSLIATIPRWVRGIRPKWMVSGSPSVRPSATFIGSTSPIRSATEVSGVASFSAYLSSRCRQVTGRSSPSSLGPAAGLGRDRLERVLAELGAVDDRGPLVQQADQRAQQAGLALAALAEQHDVVAGDQRPLELGDHRGLEAVQAGPRVLPGGQLRQQVAADLRSQGRELVAALAELSDGGCGGSRHVFTLLTTPTRRVGWPAGGQAGRRGRGTSRAGRRSPASASGTRRGRCRRSRSRGPARGGRRRCWSRPRR